MKKDTIIKEKQSNSKGKVMSNIIFGIIMLICLIVCINIVTAKIKGENPNVFGFYFYKVETDSMYPVLPRKSIIISREVTDFEKLEAGANGDIVTFYDKNNDRVTHRIVEKVNDENGKLIGFRTKGDSPNNSVDSAILYFEQIEAVFCLKLF